MSTPRITIQELTLGGNAALARRLQREPVDPNETERLAMKLLGALADATNNETRRRALDKARRMMGPR